MNNYFDSNFIKSWMNETKAEKRAIECFWKNASLYKEEDPQEFERNFPEFDPSFLEVNIQSISVLFENFPELDYNHVVVTIPIRYNEKSTGIYKILFTFDGKVEDDYFIID
ncbi:hypothetical protein [Paenibacillus macerans]|uniref:hypothetical protein n=1 Tax=Paenibacillus macerans TaxID=44252 RepID=UPI00203BAA81|nr:hypothetical protein [Paenibacillus macerans]MCM3698611.1 hypothetical protein [Paenibacillus macerans]